MSSKATTFPQKIAQGDIAALKKFPWNMRHDQKMLDGSNPLWNRQKGESAQAYEAFITYLMVPAAKRSMQGTAKTLNKSHTLISRWSVMWSWQLRCAAYEEHFLLLSLESSRADMEQVYREHRELALRARTIVNAHFETMIEQMQEGKLDAMKPADMIKLFAEATKVDRMTVESQMQQFEKIQQEQEQMMERYAEDLVAIITDLMDSCNLNEAQREKAKEVLQRHLCMEAPKVGSKEPAAV